MIEGPYEIPGVSIAAFRAERSDLQGNQKIKKKTSHKVHQPSNQGGVQSWVRIGKGQIYLVVNQILNSKVCQRSWEYILVVHTTNSWTTPMTWKFSVKEKERERESLELMRRLASLIRDSLEPSLPLWVILHRYCTTKSGGCWTLDA